MSHKAQKYTCLSVTGYSRLTIPSVPRVDAHLHPLYTQPSTPGGQ
jgi:hypothetical protein